MTERDRGVRAHLLDRKFGQAGRGSELTRRAEVAQQRALRREQKTAVQRLTEMQKKLPKRPPGRNQ